MSTEETSATENFVEAEIDVMLSQGIEGPSDAELRGEDIDESTDESIDKVEDKNDETTDAKTEEIETDDKSDDKSKDDDKDEEVETKATEEKPANSEPKATETPKGFVPLAAVHEARGEIKYLKEQLATMQTQVSNLQAKPAEEAAVEDDFEVLTDDQFEDLADDNPAAAAIYLRKLSVYESKQREAADQVKMQDEFEREYDSILDMSIAEIEKAVPGIYDDNSTVKTELMDFADGLGFTEDLYYLTNPSTKIILPGESEPLLLGEQAASILAMLANAKQKTAPPDNSALEEKLRTEITAELMKKFKTQDTNEFRGLSQVPKTDSETPEPSSFAGKVLTTEQLSKLTDAEYEAYLAGD